MGSSSRVDIKYTKALKYALDRSDSDGTIQFRTSVRIAASANSSGRFEFCSASPVLLAASPEACLPGQEVIAFDA